MNTEYTRWLTPKIEAYLWWCEDYECNCIQPVIEQITPNIQAGYPWINRKRLWEGTFASQPDYKETRKIKLEGIREARRRGLKFVYY